MAVLKKSLMPENLGELLTVKELHDLFAYLMSNPPRAGKGGDGAAKGPK